MSSSKLAKCIANPQKIIRLLEWNKNNAGVVMALDIGRERIGLALTTHSSEENIIYPEKPIEYFNRTNSRDQIKTKEQILDEVHNIIEENRVCAFVVSWPIQTNGRIGKSCGRVLHFLDYFADSSKPLISPNHPFALWEEGEVASSAVSVDKWGRSEIFSRIPSAQQKIYNSGMNLNDIKSGDSWVASHMLKDFLESQYCANGDDEVYRIKNDTCDKSYIHGLSSSIDENFLENYESNSTFLQPNLL